MRKKQVVFRLLLIFLCFVNFPVAADSLQSEWRACLASVPLEAHNRIDLANQCPAYHSKLHEQGLLQTLEPHSGKQFSIQFWQQLNELINVTTPLRSFDYSGLDGLLAGILIETEADQSKTLWNSLLAWLNSLKPEQYEHEFQWLIEFLEGLRLSEQASTFILYGLLIVVAISAVGLVFYECYIAGLFSRMQRKQRKKSVTFKFGKKSDSLLLAEIKQLNPGAQIAALLTYVINQMMTKRQLPGDPSLSNQELSAFLQQHHPQQQKFFALLVDTADPVLYGKQVPSPEVLSCSWKHVARILRE